MVISMFLSAFDVVNIFEWLASFASSININSSRSSSKSLIKPELNVPGPTPRFFGTEVGVLLGFLVAVAPVTEPAQKASNCRYNNDYGQDNKNRPE